MNIHEYQGKQIFRSMGVPVPEGRVAFTADEAVEKLKELDTDVYVVKAQIHAGVEVKLAALKSQSHYLKWKLMLTNYLGNNL